MTDEKYQCDHSPGSADKHLDMICRGCLRKIVNQRLRLLEFITIIAAQEYMESFISKEARELLKEIGEI